MSIEEKILLRDALVVLVGLPNDQVMWRSKSGDGSVITKAEQGICHNLLDLYRKDDPLSGNFILRDEILHELFEKWPKFSGNEYYPLPGERSTYVKCIPNSCVPAEYTFWEGEQGQLRNELCNFMIDELNKEISNGV